MYVKRIAYMMMMLIIILASFYAYLPPSNGAIDCIENMMGKDRLDVACIGTSHVFKGINPVQLFEESGIAAYDISSGSQAPWQSYYNIRAIDVSQHPKLIILDMYAFAGTRIDGFTEGRAVRNLINYPLSLDKYKALKASEVSSPLSVILKFPYNYDDYKAFNGLSIDKRKTAIDYGLGYRYSTDSEAYDDVVNGNEITRVVPIHPKTEEYLRKSIEYCRDNGLELLLVNTPCPTYKVEGYENYNYIQQIADEYNVPFLNGALYAEEMGMDWREDAYNNGHLNYNGVVKYTSWLNDYLNDKYSLPDRRTDENYDIYWEASQHFKEQIENNLQDEDVDKSI